MQSTRRFISSEPTITSFFRLKQFAVVGASSDPTKFGNKVLKCYVNHGYKAIPVNKKETSIENIPAFDSLTSLAAQLKADVAQTGVSIVTPPAITQAVIEEGLQLGFLSYFLQPGTYDNSIANFLETVKKDKKANIIKSCVLIQLGCHK